MRALIVVCLVVQIGVSPGLLGVSPASPSAATTAQGRYVGQIDVPACFEPEAAIERSTDRQASALDRYALLTWKESAGLFDVRTCREGWSCPDEKVWAQEKAEILALGRGATIQVSAASMKELANMGQAESLLAIFGKDMTRLNPKLPNADVPPYLRGSVGPYLNADGALYVKALKTVVGEFNGMWNAELLDHKATIAGQKREAANWANEHERMLRTSYDLAARVDVVPDSLKKRTTFLQAEAAQWSRNTQANLDRVRTKYVQDVVKGVELKRGSLAFDRARRSFDYLDAFRLGVETANAVSEQDYWGITKKSIEFFKAINDIGLEWVKDELKPAEAQLKLAVKAADTYQFSKSRLTLAPKPTLSYGLLFKRISQEPRVTQPTVAPLNAALDGLKRFKLAFEDVKRFNDKWVDPLSKLDAARKKLLIQLATEPNAKDTAFRASLPSTVNGAMTYFNSMGLLFKEFGSFLTTRAVRDLKESKYGVPLPLTLGNSHFLAGLPGVVDIPEVGLGTLGAMFDLIGQEFELAGGSIEALSRLFVSRLQGGELTAQGDYNGLADIIQNHPSLRGRIRAFVDSEREPYAIVPDGSATRTQVTRTGPNNQFDRLMAGLSTWTSLSGRNPDQDTLVALMNGTRLVLKLPYFQANAFTLSERDFTLDDLTNPGWRQVEEEQIGAVLRELSFLNASLKGLNQQYGYADLQDLAKRTFLSDLARHHGRVNEAYRIGYGTDVAASVFGAILAHSAPGGRTTATVSPLEQRIIARRNEKANQPVRPLSVTWVTSDERLPGGLDITAGIQVSGLPRGTSVCRLAVVEYPDGAKVAARLVPSPLSESPLTATFALEPLDWSKLKTSTLLNVEVTVTAGSLTDVRREAVVLDRPIALEEAIAFPSTAYPGSEVTLMTLGAVGHVTEGTPFSVDFLVGPQGGQLTTIPARELDLYNEVALAATQTYRVPPTTPPGTRFTVWARARAGSFETIGTGEFEVAASPVTDLKPFEPFLEITVVSGAGGRGGVSGAIVSVSEGGQELRGTTNGNGVVRIGPLREGSYSVRAIPSSADARNYGPAATSVPLKDFIPWKETDPNRYDVRLVLPELRAAAPSILGGTTSVADQGAIARDGRGIELRGTPPPPIAPPPIAPPPVPAPAPAPAPVGRAPEPARDPDTGRTVGSSTAPSAEWQSLTQICAALGGVAEFSASGGQCKLPDANGFGRDFAASKQSFDSDSVLLAGLGSAGCSGTVNVAGQQGRTRATPGIRSEAVNVQVLWQQAGFFWKAEAWLNRRAGEERPCDVALPTANQLATAVANELSRRR